MGRSAGSATFAGSLEVLAGAPIDARLVVDTATDLTASGTFSYSYIGMTVSVKDVGKLYMLTGADTTDAANWKEIGSGGSSGGGGRAKSSSITEEFDSTASYAVGDYVMYEDELYKCITAHSGAWAAADFEKDEVMDGLTIAEVNAIKDAFNITLVDYPEPMSSSDVEDVKDAFVLT